MRAMRCSIAASCQAAGNSGQGAMTTLSVAGSGAGQAALEGGLVQRLPDRLGHERHDRLHQPQDGVEHAGQHALRDRAPGCRAP